MSAERHSLLVIDPKEGVLGTDEEALSSGRRALHEKSVRDLMSGPPMLEEMELDRDDLEEEDEKEVSMRSPLKGLE